MKIEINFDETDIKKMPKGLMAKLMFLWAMINASKENKIVAAGIFFLLLNIFNFLFRDDMFTVPFFS